MVERIDADDAGQPRTGKLAAPQTGVDSVIRLSNRWNVLALLFLARFSSPVHFMSLPPIAPELLRDLGIGYAELGWLLGLSSLPGVFLALPGGWLGQRLGDKPLVMASLALIAFGSLLVAEAPSFAVAVVGRLLGGIGIAVLHVQVGRMVLDWFSPRETATAMAVTLSSWPLGMGLALALLGAVGEASSWRVAVGITAAVPIAALLAIGLVYRPAPRPKAPPREQGRYWTLSRTELWLVGSAGSAWMIWNAGFIVLVSFAPLLLVEQGSSLVAAGLVMSVPLWLSLVAIPLGGYLIDRTGRADLLIGTAIVGSAAVGALLPLGWVPALVLVVVLGIVRGPCAGGINALPGEVLQPNNRSLGMGVYQTVYYAGMAFVPPLAGHLHGAMASAAAAIWFSAALTAATLLPLWAFRSMQRARRPDAGGDRKTVGALRVDE